MKTINDNFFSLFGSDENSLCTVACNPFQSSVVMIVAFAHAQHGDCSY